MANLRKNHYYIQGGLLFKVIKANNDNYEIQYKGGYMNGFIADFEKGSERHQFLIEHATEAKPMEVLKRFIKHLKTKRHINKLKKGTN